uniref:PDZ and LIM domain protein 2 n=1 Tax=Cyprinus carpio TaxID=7962 RepID=A0A8C1Z1J1_CYPCA
MTFRLNLTGPPPWGFRICGGRDFKMTLTVSKVCEDSRAGDAGLQVGDGILEINGQDTGAMLNMEARNKIKTSEHQLVSFNYPVWSYGPVDPEELMRFKRRQVQPQQPRQSNTFRILQEGLEHVVTSLCKNPSIKLILSQERKVMLSFLKCSSCQECMTITGMFKRRYRHVECYTCRDCGFSLMERGHFCVDEELYCGKHAQQRYHAHDAVSKFL